jgi:hypothetical protein
MCEFHQLETTGRRKPVAAALRFLQVQSIIIAKWFLARPPFFHPQPQAPGSPDAFPHVTLVFLHDAGGTLLWTPHPFPHRVPACRPTPSPTSPTPPSRQSDALAPEAFVGVNAPAHIAALEALYAELNPDKVSQIPLMWDKFGAGIWQALVPKYPHVSPWGWWRGGRSRRGEAPSR